MFCSTKLRFFFLVLPKKKRFFSLVHFIQYMLRMLQAQKAKLAAEPTLKSSSRLKGEKVKFKCNN